MMETRNVKECEFEKTLRKKRQSRAKLEIEIIKYWNTNIPLQKIAKIIGCRQPTIKEIFIKNFSIEKVKERSKNLYKLSKLGNKNPMYKKFENLHPNFKKRSFDKKGYYTVIKPNWWTGKNKNRIFEHHKIAAIKYGLTKIPKGWEIHHCDGNGLNNEPNNLLLITKKAHAYYHAISRKCNDQSKDVDSSESKRIPSENEDEMV